MFLNFIFFKWIWFTFRFQKVHTVTKEYVKAFAFYTFKHFCYSGFWREIYLKNISTDGESEEIDEFHESQKCLGQSSSKTFSKKKFHGFCMFFKFKGSILRFFFRLFFLFFLTFFISFFKQRYKIGDWRFFETFYVYTKRSDIL